LDFCYLYSVVRRSYLIGPDSLVHAARYLRSSAQHRNVVGARAVHPNFNFNYYLTLAQCKPKCLFFRRHSSRRNKHPCDGPTVRTPTFLYQTQLLGLAHGRALSTCLSTKTEIYNDIQMTCGCVTCVSFLDIFANIT
jgi:hypothetical protein